MTISKDIAWSRRRVVGGLSALTVAGLAPPLSSDVMGIPRGSIGTPRAADSLAQGRRSDMSLVEVEPDVRLFVQDWGQGKPIVFVHGWPSNHRIFEYQLRPLAERGYRVIALDLRGFGRSDHPWDGNNYDTWAQDVGAVISALDLTDVTLVGYSMGGAIALHYVATSQDPRVTKLALVAAAAPCLTARPDYSIGAPREVFDGMVQAVTADRATFFAQFIPSLFSTPPSDATVRWMTDLCLAASTRATVRGAEEGRDRDLRPELAAIRISTRILHGVHDQLVPLTFGEEQARLIAGASLVRFEHSGHALLFEEQDRLNEELARFAA